MKSAADEQEYFRQYYLRNKARKNAQTKAYYQKNREAIRIQQNAAKWHLTEKVKAYVRQYNITNKDHIRKVKLKSLFKTMYGLSPEQYAAMVDAQNNLCAICGQAESVRPRLSIDHDHKTGKVRGLLCHNCNVGLGHFRDLVSLLKAAIEYIQK